MFKKFSVAIVSLFLLTSAVIAGPVEKTLTLNIKCGPIEDFKADIQKAKGVPVFSLNNKDLGPLIFFLLSDKSWYIIAADNETKGSVCVIFNGDSFNAPAATNNQ